MRSPHSTACTRGLRTDGERGVVLIYAMLGLFLVAGIVMAGGDRIRAVETASQLEFDAEGQARQVAESGLVDALAWLRRQPVQPVTAFTPQRDLDATPPIDETDDPAIGLVREFEISRGLWARYEVHTGAVAEDYDDANDNGVYDIEETVYDMDKNGARTMSFGALDIAEKRGVAKQGGVWYLESIGTVFRRIDDDLPLGEGPNRRIARVKLGNEVRRVMFVLPAAAAIVGGRADKTKVRGTYVESPVLGVAYRPDSGRFKEEDKGRKGRLSSRGKHRIVWNTPTHHATVPGWVQGTPNLDPRSRWTPRVTAPYISVEDVFGVSIETLKAIADYNVETLGKLPKTKDKILDKLTKKQKERLGHTIPWNSVVVITPKKDRRGRAGKVKFDRNESLIGRGIVVIDGDLEVQRDTETYFEGILFVTGDIKVEKGGIFVGTVIGGADLDFHGDFPKVRSMKSRKSSKSGRSRKSFKGGTSSSGSKSGKSVRIKSRKNEKSRKPKPPESIRVTHDPDLVAEMAKLLGNYRRSKSSFKPAPKWVDGRPDELFRTGGGLIKTNNGKGGGNANVWQPTAANPLPPGKAKKEDAVDAAPPPVKKERRPKRRRRK